MEDLVFTETPLLFEEPYTTSETIAEYAEVDRRSVMRLITQHKDDLEEFGVLRFEIAKINPGRGRKQRSYHLNEEQATLLITYLDNTKPVRKFKKALVRQFFDMKSELMKRNLQRELEKPVRRSLTDAIQEWEHRKPFSYKHITDLICKAVTGNSTKQLKQERGVNQSVSGTDIYTSSEMAQYQKLEDKVMMLLEMNMDYQQIKAVINGQTIEVTLPTKQKA